MYHLPYVRRIDTQAKRNCAYDYTKLAVCHTKEDTMASLILLCVGLVYMSTSRNGITFGAPTGSVNSLPSAIKNVL